MAEYNIKKGPFRFWCQKILPLVYDDSLSYYELLCRVVDYLNKEMEDISAVTTEMQELQEYVSTYFENVDISSEINAKLDAMAEDGTLTELIGAYIQPRIDELEGNVNNQLNDMSDIIDENVARIDSQNNIIGTQNNRITVLEGRMDKFSSLPDGSLSTTADAELVDIRVGADGTQYSTAGDAVRGMDTKIINRFNGSVGQYPAEWEVGGINNTTGAEYSGNNIRTKKIMFTDSEVHVYNPKLRTFSISMFKADDTLYKIFGGMTDEYTVFSVPANTSYIRFMITSSPSNLMDANEFIIFSEEHSYAGKLDGVIKKGSENSAGYKPLVMKYGYITSNADTIDIGVFMAGATYKHVVDDCTQGDTYFINGVGADAARLWAFVDANGNTISKAANGLTTQGKYIPVVAPADATHIVINSRVAANPVAFKKVYSAGDIITGKFATSMFKNGRYAPASGIYERDFIIFTALKEYVPEYVVAIGARNNVRLCINIWVKATGAYQGNRFWVTKADSPFVFDHTRFLYKFYAGYDDSSTIFDLDALTENIDMFCNKTLYFNAINTMINDIDAEDESTKAIGNALQIVMGKTAYDIKYANAGVPITLENYTGNTQNVHPKVLYFAGGFGGHKYWMAYTPYPFSSSSQENPCIAFSDDGINWKDIIGNPLDNPEGDGYNSDTHLVYRSDLSRLECWYRYVGSEEQSPREETIKRTVSTDGITWSNEETVLSNTTGEYAKYLSPAIIWDGTNYCIWVVDDTGAIKYYEASPASISSWTLVSTFDFSFTDKGYSVNPWHLDVIHEDGKYVMLVSCRRNTNLEDNPMSLFILTSTDNITYSAPYKVVEGSETGWDKYMYRSSIVKVDDEYWIYYSATNGGNESIYRLGAIWGIGVTKSKSLDRFIGVY